MNKLLGILMLFTGFAIPGMAQNQVPKATITISNPSSEARTGEVVAIKWSDITARYPGIDTANFKVIDPATKKEIPFQLEHKGLPAIQSLLVQISLKANASNKLILVAGKPAAVLQKTYGRYVPERYDDFAWENDKVAYRIYGKALESRKDNAYGIDVWVKKTSKLVVNEWYKIGDYHKDHGDGMDYYSVGLTLGAGDIAPYIGDSIYYSKNYHHWKVLDNGPLRTSFQVGYDERKVAGKPLSLTKTITLDAGSHMNKIEVNYTYAGTETFPVVIGIVKRAEPGSILMDEQQGILGYWEPVHGEDGTTGVATVVTGKNLMMNTDKAHLLTHALAKNKEPLVYYNGSAWSKGNEITNAKQWFDYLNRFRTKVAQPLKVAVL